MDEFDVVVIGTGVAGQTVAEDVAAAGMRVAIADRREYGGTCMLRGCEAKKVLYEGAVVVERAAAQRGKGPAGELRLDWPSLVSFKREFTEPVPKSIEEHLKEVGVTTLHGAARFLAPDRMEIGGRACRAENILLATGARPVPLGIDGEDLVLTSEDLMAADELPPRVLFIGGGYIAFEFAHFAAAAGAAVTVCHRSAQVLKGFDRGLADMLADSYRECGIDVRTEAPVVAVHRDGGALTVLLDGGERLVCDMVVHAAGRRPHVDDLDLDAGDVRHGARGVEVDDHLRSVSNPRVWAAGDCVARGLPLTPVGIIQGHVVARGLLGEPDAVYDAELTPSVVFSHPPLAAVGLTLEQAEERGLEVRGELTDRSSWAPYRRVGARVAGARVLVEEHSGHIVGAHLLGHHADEVVNVFVAAMKGGLTADELRSMPWAYPTGAWDIVYLV